MDKKYYIPIIEEFYNNFEYEYFQDEKWNTEGFTIYSPVLVADVLLRLKDDKIRVKYLDKDDIESLGFELEKFCNTDSNNKIISTYTIDGRYSKPIKGSDDSFGNEETNELFVDFSRNFVLISEDYGFVIFQGVIKNKSELKTLLKWLNVGVL